MNMNAPDMANIPNSSPEMAVLRKLRVGLGMDVHAFAPNRKLILGGVDIPHHQGLDGHSDADVLLHAIADALLGAARLGISASISPTPIQPIKMPIRSSCSRQLRICFVKKASRSLISIASSLRKHRSFLRIARRCARTIARAMRHRNGKYRRESHHHRTSRL